MHFINEEHELFFISKLKELYTYGKINASCTSLIYTLGICETTRKNFDSIINLKEYKVNIDALSLPWQHEKSEEITRMAFALYDDCMHNKKEDVENNQISKQYSLREILASPYSIYFYEALKLKYPECIKKIRKNIRRNNNESER